MRKYSATFVKETFIGKNVETFSLRIFNHKQYCHNVNSHIFNDFLSVLLLTLPVFFYLMRCGPTRVMAFTFLRFLGHKQRQTTIDRTPLDE